MYYFLSLGVSMGLKAENKLLFPQLSGPSIHVKDCSESDRHFSTRFNNGPETGELYVEKFSV